jgi:hypothetical protein
VAQKRQEAMAAVPDEMVLRTAVLGDERAVTQRLRAYADVGIDLLMPDPIGSDATARLDIIGRATELAAALPGPTARTD